jgi:hypothetical protein
MSLRGVCRGLLLAGFVASVAVAAAAHAELRPPTAPRVERRPPTRPRQARPARPDRTGAERMCEKQLVVTRTEGAEGCFIDERVTQTSGVLRYACDGNGDAQADFAGGSFVGSIASGRVNLVLHTQFDFSDGCAWMTDQRLRGSVASGELDYSYNEAARPGQRGCAPPCAAHARARVR